jgi:hypothetical protein
LHTIHAAKALAGFWHFKFAQDKEVHNFRTLPPRAHVALQQKLK